jgi:hypothetical protein
MCVSSVTNLVLMNFYRVEPIISGGCLRQGDPVSLYLFILVVVRLSTLTNNAVGQGDLHGVKVYRGAS